jgi:hypothetical protein
MNRLSVFIKWVLDVINLLAFYIIGWYSLNASWVDWLFEGVYGLFGNMWLFGIPNLIFAFGISFFTGVWFLFFIYEFYISMNQEINQFCGTEHTSIQIQQMKKLFISPIRTYIPFKNIFKMGIQKPLLYLIHLMGFVLVIIHVDSVILSHFREYHDIPIGTLYGNEIIYTRGEFPPNYFICFFALLSLLLSIFWVIFHNNESTERANKNY